MSGFLNFYCSSITRFRSITLLLILAITAFFGYYMKDFRLDASSDTLVLQGNENLEYYDEIKERYGSDDYLIITYTPKTKDLFSEDSLKDLEEIKAQMKELERVNSVTSILDVPLLESPKVSLTDLRDGRIVSIENENFTNLKEVREELKTNAIYKNTLISADAKTTAMLVNFNKSTDEDIARVREIVGKYKDDADIYIGGVPMIVADSIDFIEKDIETFSLAVVALIILLLALSFKKVKWVVIPLANSLIACAILTGILGFLDWPVTVVSSNFISLLLILSLSLSIHLVVMYEELLSKKKYKDQDNLILDTVKEKFYPCLYTAITTIVAFTSLIISDVKPVIDFGWMMVMGIVISLILTFTFFPALIGFFKYEKKAKNIEFHKAMTDFIFRLTSGNRLTLFLVFLIVSTAGVYGITKLSVQNRFIDYYKKDTEIYQGMEVIDRRLGGTTPMEVIVDAPESFEGKDYWFNSFILEDVEMMHDYLNSLEETGKVLSLHSTMQLLKTVNDGDIDSFVLTLVREKISKELQDILISPYLSKDGNQVRFGVRIYESIPGLDREELISQIEKDMKEQFYLKEGELHINGMLVLYNDLLQSLFKSQILTLGVVLAAIAVCFMILFRNLKVSLIATIPVIVACTSVLGLMGLLGISLDIMTITIAAICIGIGVDDTIHYIHRFEEELAKDGKVWKAIERSHASIGRALYLTTITVTLGFSVLALSNFVPTIYFGLLTGFSMIIALLANLILLPILLGFFSKNLASKKD